MASKESKIVRRAQAMSQLGFLSKLLAEQFNLETVSVDVTNRDSELAEIQRIEIINALLAQLVEVGKPDGNGDIAVESEPASVRKSSKKHGANK